MARGRWCWRAGATRRRTDSRRWDGRWPGPRPVWTPASWGSVRCPAARTALERASLTLDDMDLVEVNEAFAAQYLAVEREMGLDRERTNVDGGAVALGHPLGASGARITLHLLHALRRRGGRYGLGSRVHRRRPGHRGHRGGFQLRVAHGLLLGGLAVAVLYSFMSLRVLRQYERGVAFFLGRYWGTKGPGLIFLPAGFASQKRVSLRIVAVDIPPQDVITRDNVSVKVNAVLYMRVSDPAKAVIEIEDYLYATSQLAQTTLRSVLGEVELDELLSDREKINAVLKKIIDERTEPWGIEVSAVEVKDVDLPGPDEAGDGAAGGSRARASGQGHRRPGRAAGVGDPGAGGPHTSPPSRGHFSSATSRPSPRSPPRTTRPPSSRCRSSCSAPSSSGRPPSTAGEPARQPGEPPAPALRPASSLP